MIIDHQGALLTTRAGRGPVLASEFGDLRVELDPGTGAPCRLWLAGSEDDAVEVDVAATLVTGGTDRGTALGGLAYEGTQDVHLAGSGIGRLVEQVHADRRTFELDVATTEPGRWSVRWRHELRATAPRLAVSLGVRAGTDEALLRDVRLDIAVRLPDRSNWRLQAPGNRLRPDVPLANVTRPVAVMTPGGGGPAGGGVGSTALVGLERVGPARTVAMWPFGTVGIGAIVLEATPDGAHLAWTTDIAGRPSAGGTLTCGILFLDVLDLPFRAVLRDVPAWLAERGVGTPPARPAWAAAMNAYEVMIGDVVFTPGHRYAPYPELADLLADLDRVAGLGYNAIQVMPRQPSPGYRFVAIDDPGLAYGDETLLRGIVAACHARGMRVLLDVILHGVLDRRTVTSRAASAGTSPFASRTDPIPDVTVLDALDPEEADLYAIAGARGRIESRPADERRLPERHPLLDLHPEWFTRDSAGDVTGIHNLGFDMAHPGFQKWVTDCLLDMARHLDVDGFRLDAPAWNAYHNWSPRTRTNAAVSQLGALTLFEQLRAALHEVKPDAVLYTEPSSALWRRSMDLVYNYDEQWLVRAVLTGGSGRAQEVRNARELARWLADRNAALPPGSLTAHHLDSHDTFWYPEPGMKWRREQWGVPAARALATVLALSGGAYMTFVGGEAGMEERVRAIGRLRASRPELSEGQSDYEAVRVADDDVYAVVQRGPTGSSLVVVNLADRTIATACRLAGHGADIQSMARPGVPPAETAGTAVTHDLLAGADVAWQRAGDAWETGLLLEAYGAMVLALDGTAGPAAEVT
jgi:hypothetical protein